MNAETVSSVSTGTAITSGAVATGAVIGWIGQVNEWIPVTMGFIAVASLALTFLTYRERRKQTKMMETRLKDDRGRPEKTLAPDADDP